MLEDKPKLKVLDLFSGILVGGFSLGLERTGGFETVAFCEIEEFPRRVLAKHWQEVPIYHDVRYLTKDVLDRDGITVDVITGGFPCQDISPAGKKAGIGGAKSSLWGQFSRLIGEIRPNYVILENSSELLNRGAGDVLGNLAAWGYNAEWQCISAAVLGAPHGRDRFYAVAYPNYQGEPGCTVNDEEPRMPPLGYHDVADTKRGKQSFGRVMARVGRVWESVAWDGLWSVENSPIGLGMDDGVPNRMDRLRSLGNAVVPQIPEMIGRAILEAEGAQ